MAKLIVWLFLVALFISQINAETYTYRNRRQRQFSQQSYSPSSVDNIFLSNNVINYDQSGQRLDLSHLTAYLEKHQITLGNIPYNERGDWGEWSAPSECSRTCGGGVIRQTRICLDSNCEGPKEKYTSCNLHDCDPNELDFRARQCFDYNTRIFKGRYFSWVPYQQAPNPCELNCQAMGERFYYRHAEKVIDGTKCYNDGSLDICVDGKCLPLGCDRILGSMKMDDKCGTCGGDGSTCNVVHGLLENDYQMRTGYNELLTIPAGAMNIKIEEIQPTSNYLAIRNMKGNYYLNGNWKIEFGRSLKFAGTVFNYVKRPSDGAEILTSKGPISEPLVLMLLFQERNQGISYEYATKKNDTSYEPLPPNIVPDQDRVGSRYPYPSRSLVQYRWWHGDFTPCSSQCNGGQQQRRVVCMKITSASQLVNMTTHELPAGTEIIQDQYCDARRKPAPVQNCNTHVCPPIWQVGHWSKCICDSKVKVRSVFCKKGTTHPDTGRPIPDVWIVANDDECDEVRGANRRPPSVKPCDENEECSNATVATNATSTANVTTTTAVDETNESSKNETEPLSDKKQLELDDLLNEMATVPPVRKCEVTYAYKWNIGNWTECDARCGDGNQKRNVTCVEIDPTTGRLVNEDRALPDLYCRHEEKPTCERKCNDVPCLGVDWVISEWSKCVADTEADSSSGSTTEASSLDVPPNQNGHLKNQTKLSTVQTRTVLCATEFGLIYADERCGLSRKPETRRKCEKKQAVAQWFTSEWSSCSAMECSMGVRTRSVLCAVHSDNGNGEQTIKIVDEKDCNENVKPKCEEECVGKKPLCDELIVVGPWTGCVDRCEETRSLTCLVRNETTLQIGPVDCENKSHKFELRRKCENEDAKDSVDEVKECNPDTIAKNCTSSEFGCCPGTAENAEGPNFKGCPPKLNDECEKTTFGCCQHSRSESFGPFQLGCILNCNNTRFGCCVDQVSIATTESKDNCLPLCASTEFGCCKDNSTATDSEKSNCPENAKKPVLESKVPGEEEDCVEDEIVIEGSGSVDEIEGSGDEVNQIDPRKSKKVCKKKTSCKNTKFGCCDDQTTIKLDENGLGCDGPKSAVTADVNCEKNPDAPSCNGTDSAQPCHLTEFGCVLDDGNITADPKSCKSTPFGCCPDGENVATGPNQEGCNDCKKSKYGCCKDGKTVARGQASDGRLDCPCDATEFGCCPDRLTEAKGPDSEGCPCETLTHGCCPDNKTPAKGPRFQGCDCSATPHGCCPDGLSVAYGPHRLGCPDGPSLDLQSSTPACSLPKERGNCRNFSVKWFFDQAYGGCSRFWYGGCEGNGNRFASQDECEGICMRPKGRDACLLPLVKGSCNQEKVYWGYNSQKHVCEKFTYGGCLGNNNRFESLEQCESTCFYSENNDPCEQPLNIGKCNGNVQRYFYNKHANRCDPFVYSNCGGNANNFYSEFECRNRCGARTARDICLLPVSPGPCLGKFPRYFFNYKSGTCQEFTYGGCLGNNNRFVDRESCERLCNSTASSYRPSPYEQNQPPPIIRLPLEEEDGKKISAGISTLQYICNNNKDPGQCDGSQEMWYYNPLNRQCDQFVYSGCGGNNNRFESKYECEGRCIHQLNNYLRMQQAIIVRQQKKVLEEQENERRRQLENQVAIKQNICLQPRETGNCYNFVQRFYYDKDDRGCHRFYYSGCGANGNNFATFEECTQRCGTTMMTSSDQSNAQLIPSDQQPQRPFRKEDCFLSADRGLCNHHDLKWFYDSRDGVCKTFYWSRCGGNNNRFQNGRECQTRCWGSQNICLLPKVVGPCQGNYSQWYYDGARKECLEFNYGGCQGNANRFSSKESCLESCSSQNNNQMGSQALNHVIERTDSICHLPSDRGQGYEYLEYYYYDPIQNMCKMFIYTGLGGNENRFEQREQCERQCADAHKLELQEPTDLKAEKANEENESKLKEHAKEIEADLNKQLETERHKLDEEYQKMKDANKEMAKKYKKEFEDERAKIEVNLTLIEKKIKDLRIADEDDRMRKLKAKAKELEEQNTKKLKEEAGRLEAEAKVQIKEISAKLEDEMNSPEKKNQLNIEVETNKKRMQKVAEINEKNLKTLEQMEKKLEEEAMAILDELAKQLETEAKMRLEKQIEEERKEHQVQLKKLKEALTKLSKSGSKSK